MFSFDDEDLKGLIEHIGSMKSPGFENYIVHGLTSNLLNHEGAKVRVFTMNEKQGSDIIPHSHRFDLFSIVLRGSVENTIWTPQTQGDDCVERSVYNQCTRGEVGKSDTLGKYDFKPESLRGEYFKCQSNIYEAGEAYFMKANEIHSIRFGVKSVVLLFEGPTIGKYSRVLLHPDQLPEEEMAKKSWQFKCE